jgi:hypothetical protein
MAGQSQSPFAILAETSTRPYFMRARSLVLMRPESTGWIIVPLVVLVLLTQSAQVVEVQVPSARRLMTLLLVRSFSSWSLGLIVSLPSLMKMTSSEAVVCSNCWLLVHYQRLSGRFNFITHP